jgi:transposase
MPYKHSRIAYRRRNRIERLIGRIKNWRGVATRYDRLAYNYLAAIALVSCVIAWT